MGWCQEFGLHIAAGCDHAMIAGADSCSCADCGTVCDGRFTGCPIVWSEAGTWVTVAAETPARGSGAVQNRPVFGNGKTAVASETVATNGRVPLPPLSPAELPPAALSPLPPAALPPLPPAALPPPPVGSHSAVTSGPGTGSAENDLRQLCADLGSEVHRLGATVDRLAAGGERSQRDAVLRDVDARFAWLTKELSDRLVVLGNEIVAMKRHLETGRD